MGEKVKGFGRRPLRTVVRDRGPASESLPRRKPRGGRGTVWRARLWGNEDRGRLASAASAAVGARCFRRKRRRGRFLMATTRGSEALASVEGGLATSRGHRAHVPARGWRRRRSTVRGGMRGDGHELSILIRLGDGERQGRGPSKVSTTIIRPPQHGQRRAGETSSARLSASREGWGAFSAAASNCRARSMLSGSNRAGEEAVVSDAVEAARQHVQEKAADELVRPSSVMVLSRSRPLMR